MIIDTHCHFDMTSHPEIYINRAEISGEILIGMTNLPSHFKMGYGHIRGYKHIRLALGFHPLMALDHQRELSLFSHCLDLTSYIGEIGLDFSHEGYKSKDIQISSIRYILEALQGKNKIISIHSRRAELVLFDLLKEYNIPNVIFHWYTGPISLISDIVAQGYYFSINEYMTLSSSGKKTIAAIPRNRILTETDVPYNPKTSIRNVLSYTNMSEEDVNSNFKSLLQSISNKT